MKTLIEVWTRHGCARCEEVLAALAKEYCGVDHEIVEHDIDRLVELEPRLRDQVNAALQMQDGALPVLRVAGELVDPFDLLAAMGKCNGSCEISEAKRWE